jgi:uncharacterized protein YegP (UPF0339 family)
MIFEIIHAKEMKKSKLHPCFYFNLKANNGEIVATSEMYESKQGCLKGISAVRRCFFAKVIDKT